MKKHIKNRGVFAKTVLIVVAICVLIATAICIFSCNKKYDENAYTIEFSAKNATFTLPKDAKIRVDKKIKNYVYEEVTPIRQKSTGNLVQYVFENNYNQTFRIEKEGCITRAGYFEQNGRVEIIPSADENVWDKKSYSGILPNGYSGIDDIMLTNVGDNYFKVLALDEKFCLRAFRNTMIVDNYTSNVEIEPNFDWKIEGDSVAIKQTKENIFEVVAQQKGVTKVILRYQAIEVLNNGKLFRYNASDKRREAVLTFAVGESYTTDIEIKAIDRDVRDFDSEFDTVYFEGEIGELDLKIAGVTDLLCNGDCVKPVDDIYNLTIKEGANYVEIKKGDKGCYMTIYGAKIIVKVENVTTDRVKIDIQGVYTAIPKVSGVYNPTQKHDSGSTPTNGSMLQLFFLNGKYEEAQFQSQYYSGANCTFEFDVKEYLVNEQLVFDMAFCYEWWGDELGCHRKITDSGVDNNLNAVLNQKVIGFFPKVTI